jgi:hypothetical protein
MKEILVNNMDAIQSMHMKNTILSAQEILNKQLLADWVLVYQTDDDALVHAVAQWFSNQESQEYLALADACRRGQSFDLLSTESCPVCKCPIKFNNAWISQCERGHSWGNVEMSDS